MSPNRIVGILLSVLLAAVFGYRAVEGLATGSAMEGAKDEIYEDRHEQAIPLVDRAAHGANRLEALLLSANTRLDVWKKQVNLGGHLSGEKQYLDEAVAGYLECLCVAPASRRAWQGLGRAYELLEWSGRERRAQQSFDRTADPWSRVGRPGRISLGIAQLAIERAPNWFSVQDALARRLWDFGLEPEALDAVERSARVLPIYARHAFRTVEDPRPIIERFTEASWSVLGQVPLLHPVDHLIDLGKLEYSLGRTAKAQEAFERALAGRSDPINRAEADFYLGLVQRADGDPDVARDHFVSSSEHPAFRVASLSQLAALAEAAGDHAVALDYLRRLRREDPRNLDYCLRYSVAAGRLKDWPAALESLRWARMNYPQDPRVVRALGEAYLESGDPASARLSLRELAEIADSQPEYDRLRRAIDARNDLRR